MPDTPAPRRPSAEERAAQIERLREEAKLEAARAGANRWMDRLTGGEGSLRWPAIALAGFVLMVAGCGAVLASAGSLRLPLGGLAALATAIYFGIFSAQLIDAATGHEGLRVVFGVTIGAYALMALPGAFVALMAAFAGFGPIRFANVVLAGGGAIAMLGLGVVSACMAWLALSRDCKALAPHPLFARERLRS